MNSRKSLAIIIVVITSLVALAAAVIAFGAYINKSIDDAFKSFSLGDLSEDDDIQLKIDDNSIDPQC